MLYFIQLTRIKYALERESGTDQNGHRTQKGNPFTGYFVRDVLSNRFYEGKVIYHKGQLDEQVIEGIHEVPKKVKRLWNECQIIKKRNLKWKAGHPRKEARSFPFSSILKCQYCGQPYYGETVDRGGWIDLRLTHERRFEGRFCEVKPRSRSVKAVVDEFGGRVMPYLQLPITWKEDITKALLLEKSDSHEEKIQRLRIEKAIENTRKQHKWGDIDDQQYLREKQDLERQLKTLNHTDVPINMPNLDRAAKLLEDFPALWSHPGVEDSQREALIREVFANITMGEKNLVSIEPKPEYAPLFASIVIDYAIVENRKMDSPPSPPEIIMSLNKVH